MIESLQTKKDYTEESTYVGGGFSVGATGKTSYGGSASRGNMDSNYESVSNQAGIYAGNEGFDINVKEDTNLKAGVIDSDASSDKNSLTTGTLAWEDTENEADYTAGGMGVSYASKDKESELNQRGLTPNITPTVKDNADSTTKSAVAEGTITITDKANQKQDISTLNRDTKNSLNQLQEIFDKTEVQERQELAYEFANFGAEKIGDIAKENNWSADDPRRTLLHGLLGGITANIGGNNILSGAVAEGGMESLQPMLDSFLKDHPDMREDVALIFGYAVGNLFGGDGEIGAAVAWNGTAFNWLTHEQMKEYAAEMESATEEEQKEITAKWMDINAAQGDSWVENQGIGGYIDLSGEKGVLVKDTPVNTSGNIWPTRTQIFTSLGENTAAEALNYPWNKAMDSLTGGVKTGVKWGLRFGGTAGATFTLIDVTQDYKNYSGWRLGQALIYDTFPVIGGVVGSSGGVLGAIIVGTGGDLLKSALKDKIPTDKQLKDNEQRKGADDK